MNLNVRKASQVVAFFARERGGALEIIEASKLVYIADRFFMDRYGITILGDVFYNMEHGPVCSNTYDLMKGDGEPHEREEWEQHVTKREGNVLRAAKELDDEALDEISDAELEHLYEIAKEFESFKRFQLVNWVHDNCAEWENPGKSSSYLSFREIFEALGKKNAPDLDRKLNGFRKINAKFARAK